MNSKLMNYLDIEDLPPDLKDVAEECGLDIVKSLLQVFPSTNIYIPNLKNLEPTVKKYIKDRYRAHSARDLARQLNLSEPHIRKMIRMVKAG